MTSRRLSAAFMFTKSLFSLAALLSLACSGAVAGGDGGNALASGGAAGAAGSAAQASGSAGASVGSCAAANAGAAASTSSLGGAAGVGGETDDEDALIVPQGLGVIPRPGLNSAFNVIALTLRQGSGSLQLFASVRNDGTVPSCNPSFSVELHDTTDTVIAAGITGLMVPHLYKVTDVADTIAGCIAPGEVTMAAITDSSLNVALEDVVQVVYGSSYWNLDVVPTTSMLISDVQAVTQSAGVAYSGTLVNGLDVTLGNPAVEVFPVNRVGRPLGVALAGGSVQVPPCGSWPFTTNSVTDPGVGFVAFPAGSQ